MFVFVHTFALVTLLFTSICGVDVDYYYSSGLRSETLACRNALEQLNCQIKCNMKPALCIQDSCYCTSIAPIKEKVPEIPYIGIESLYALRPTVRHHIAHFCPNLDVARTCIRKCMKKGKPAFCGKDHVCYCGHRYEHTGKDQDGDAKEIYAQFKDLYKKYFGPNYQTASLEV